MKLPWISKKSPGWMSVCLYADRVELAHVCRPAQGRPQVRALHAHAREGAPRELLQRLARAHGLKGFRCATALAAGEYQLVQVEAPAVPDEEFRQALRWQLKDQLDFPLESATVDGFALPADGGGRRPQAFAAAARSELVAARIADFDAARIGLEAIDVPELALRNVAVLLEDENRGLAFLVLQEAAGLLTLTWKGELYAARRIEIGAGALRDAPEERRGQLVERLVLEVQRSLDNFDRQYNFIATSKLVFTPLAAAPALQSELAASLYVPVHPLDLAQALDCSAVPELADPARQVAALQTLGVALRAEAP